MVRKGDTVHELQAEHDASMMPGLETGIRMHGMVVLQYDNGPKYTSRITTALLRMLKIKVMDCPSS